MLRDGAIIFGDLIGKLGVLRIDYCKARAPLIMTAYDPRELRPMIRGRHETLQKR